MTDSNVDWPEIPPSTTVISILQCFDSPGRSALVGYDDMSECFNCARTINKSCCWLAGLADQLPLDVLCDPRF